jgi:hypothetical protein
MRNRTGSLTGSPSIRERFALRFVIVPCYGYSPKRAKWPDYWLYGEPSLPRPTIHGIFAAPREPLCRRAFPLCPCSFVFERLRTLYSIEYKNAFTHHLEIRNLSLNA